MRPLFSIIIPVYGVEPFLGKCLDSVMNQTFTDWECICVDDGSSDRSGRILDEYKMVFNGEQRFEVIHQTNGGVSVARNTALDIASGKWIQFLDADDSLKPDFLEQLSKDILKFPDVDAIEHTAIYCMDDGQQILGSTQGKHLAPECVITGQDILSDPFGKKYTNLGRCSCYKIFRRSVIVSERMCFMQGLPLSEDELFAAQFYAFAGKVALCPKTAGYLRIFREGSASNTISLAKLLPKLRMLEALYNIYQRCPSRGLAANFSARTVVTAYLGNDQSQHIRKKCVSAIINSAFFNRKAVPFLLLHGKSKMRIFALIYILSPSFICKWILLHFFGGR